MTEWPDWTTYRTRTARADAFSESSKNTFRDAAREVLAAINGINLLGPAAGVVWRGQANKEWRLESRAGRLKMDAPAMRAHETEMLRQARMIGADNAQYMGDWEILARLRHHGAATRLIDCTTDPFVALWFLVDDDSPDGAGGTQRDHDGLLLALQRKQFEPIKRPYDRNYDGAFDDGREPAALIYTTPPIDPRIAAQRGVFILHTEPRAATEWPESELGPLTYPSPQWEKNHAKKLASLCDGEDLAKRRGRMNSAFPDTIALVVPSQVKSILLEMLETNFGFTRATMFPDFAGMGEYYAVARG